MPEFRLGDGDFQVVDVGSPQRDLRQPGAGRCGDAGNGDEVQIGKFRPSCSRPVRETRLVVTPAPAPQERGESTMSIGAVLARLRDDFLMSRSPRFVSPSRRAWSRPTARHQGTGASASPTTSA